MSRANQVLALLKSHVDGDDSQFLSVAMQVAAEEARLGHIKIAQQLRDLVDKARKKPLITEQRGGNVVVLHPKGEFASLVSVQQPEVNLNDMSLPAELRGRLARVIEEERHQTRLREHGLRPRRKLLLLGAPGTGKTMTAAALAGELRIPLFTILLEAVITKFMGETANKLGQVFSAMYSNEGVYLFDEFDAIGARRDQLNDVGEIRRVLNSFLQLLEKDDSRGLIIAATNHPDLLDSALYRRFDDVLEYEMPTAQTIKEIVRNRLAPFDITQLEWTRVTKAATGLSQAEIVRACDEAAKHAVLSNSSVVSISSLEDSFDERKRTPLKR